MQIKTHILIEIHVLYGNDSLSRDTIKTDLRESVYVCVCVCVIWQCCQC